MRLLSKKQLIKIIIVLSLFSLAAYLSRAGQATTDGLRIYFLDVGQGDSIFIETPKHHQILIDGGPDNTVLAKLSSLMPSGDRTIDLVVVTHPHKDHIAGLPEVLRRYDVAKLAISGVTYDASGYLNLLNTARARKVISEYISKPEKETYDDGVTFEFLAPLRSFEDQQLKNVHDSMVVTKISYEKSAAILTGDMETSLEEQLIAAHKNLSADILKVGHHGSRTSTGEAFLKAISPREAVIEVGAKNDYGHPHASTLKRLQDHGIRIWRTDLDQDVLATIDAGGYRMSSASLHLDANLVRMLQNLWAF